ncbi:ATPase, partial [Methylobacterium frigidaeris]
MIQATESLRARPWLGDLVALGATAVALGVRLAVDDVLPPGFPYLTFFPAVILTTFFCGLRAGITCATLSGLFAWYFFLPPSMGFIVSAQSALALAFYVFIVAVDIALIHIMHTASARLRRERTVTAG